MSHKRNAARDPLHDRIWLAADSDIGHIFPRVLDVASRVDIGCSLDSADDSYAKTFAHLGHTADLYGGFKGI